MKEDRGRAVITPSLVFKDSSSPPSFLPSCGTGTETRSSSALRDHQISKLKGPPRLSGPPSLPFLTTDLWDGAQLQP